MNTIEAILGPALITLSIAIVLAIAAAAVYVAYTVPEVFFTALALVAGFFGFAYWKAAREARRAAAKQAEAGPRDLADDEPQS